MRPAFAGHPIAETLLLLSLAVWFVFEGRQALQRRTEATDSDRGSLMVLRIAIIGGVLLAATALRLMAAPLPYNPALFAVCLVVIWAGIGLRYWSFRSLGRYFTFTVMTSTDQPVIMTGPYRFLRHPSYLGLLLVLAGLGLSLGSWLSFAAMVLVPLAGFINRIRIEEAALSATLGSAYTDYARSRKRLIPFVW